MISPVGVELANRAGVVEGALSYVYALVVSTLLLVGFTWSMYRLLTNMPLTWRETLPGALVASVLLQASFQILPTSSASRTSWSPCRPTAGSCSCSSGCT